MARPATARTSPKTAASRNGFHVGTAGAAKLAGTTKPAGKPHGPAGVGPHPLAAHIEKIPVTIFETSSDASRAVAHEIAELIRTKAARRQMAVLGLATGSTPQGVYEELVRLHKEDGLSFANVITFNLDEYWPMEPGALQSYRRFMREHLFDLVNIKPENIHVPDGTVPQNEVDDYCKRYEKAIEAAGGIDIQILGIGRTGHVGFNEPGSARDSRTRLITLDHVTRMDASSDFFGEWNVPSRAITMGVGSILSARKLLLMAFGEHKANIVKRAVEGAVSQQVSASFLQEHPSARFMLDPAAAAELTRVKTPWLLGSVEDFGLTWDTRTTKKAVLWLARSLSKPILKLTNEDYNEHGLQQLVSTRQGGAYEINIDVFESLRRTITGWPGGRPKSKETAHSRTTDVHAAGQFPKRVVVFSPHPDDDVISMGGTFIRLCDQGHEVHVAYQTSGNIAVWDEAAIRHADFVSEFCREFKLAAKDVKKIEQHVANFVTDKEPGEVDTPELQKIKGLIRRTEARAAARYSGVKPDRIHFLDMPFYETGRVKKKPLSQADVDIITKLLEEIQPHQIYAAGDLSDPHGTHRVCLAAIFAALRGLTDRKWMKQCDVWLYRGAWAEWDVDEIEMAVPLAPNEVARKRIAIFKHESQKDSALFPGPSDPREFWQRAEDRNRNTAELYDKLGLPEYQAVEGFVRWKDLDTALKSKAKSKAASKKR